MRARGKTTFAAGDRVLIVGKHPWAEHTGTLVEYGPYGLGWHGWLVLLDDGYHYTYVSNINDLRLTKQ